MTRRTTAGRDVATDGAAATHMSEPRILGHWVWDVERDHFRCDDAILSLLGRARGHGERIPIRTVLDAIVADERAGVERAVNAALEHGTPLRIAFSLDPSCGGSRIHAEGRWLPAEDGRSRLLTGVVTVAGQRAETPLRRLELVKDILKRTRDQQVPEIHAYMLDMALEEIEGVIRESAGRDGAS